MCWRVLQCFRQRGHDPLASTVLAVGDAERQALGIAARGGARRLRAESFSTIGSVGYRPPVYARGFAEAASLNTATTVRTGTIVILMFGCQVAGLKVNNFRI